MTLRFDQPLWLLLLLLAVPTSIAGLRWFSSMSRPRRWSAVLVRVVLLALIAAALSGASLVRTSDRVAVVAVVDVSGSVRRFFKITGDPAEPPEAYEEAVRAFLTAAARGRRPDDLLGVVLFDGRPLAVTAPSRGDAPLPEDALDIGSNEGTDLAAAIRLAAGMIPPDAAGRIVLFSDGNQTRGNALQAARELTRPGAASAARFIPIDAVPLAYAVTDEVILEAVDSPPVAPRGATVAVRVVLHATRPTTGTLHVRREGEPLDIDPDGPGLGRRVSLQPGRNVEHAMVPLEEGRVHRFEAVFEPDGPGDTVLTNNRAEAFTITPGKGAVLVVDGVSPADPEGPGSVLPRALRESGIDARVVSPEGVRADLLWLQAYDLVILQNVPADALSDAAHRALVGYVTELGGGLVMVGGPDSFGAGGWKGTDLEPILPVRLDLPDKLVMPAAAVVLVIDSSGSMNGRVMGSFRTQQEIANEGAAVAIESLDRSDLVGVIAFDDDARTVIPLAPNASPAASARRVRAVQPDGGTNLPPALELAHRQLAAAQAEVRHVIVLSDGRSQNTELLPEAARRMAEDGIRISSIAVGDSADAEGLAEIASIGRGQFYRVTDPTLLPRIFVRAVRIVRTPLIRESPFQPVLLPVASPLTDGLSEPPPLRGLVLTQPRPEPTIVYAMAAPTGEPLLAHWNAGIGRVAAFTSDAHRWARDWLGWPGYARLWTQTVRSIARPSADRAQELITESVGDRLRIRLDAADAQGRPLDLLTVPGSVYAPDGTRTEVRLAQTGPGRYEASVPAAESGNYVLTLTPRLGAGPLAPVIGGASRAGGAEYRRLRADTALLTSLAETTGGRVHALDAGAAADLFRRDGLPAAQWRSPLWRTLLGWIVAVMLLDVATRRVAWDRLISREFGRDLRRQAAEAVRSRGEQAASAVGRLRERDQRIETARPEAPVAQLSDEDAREIVRAQAERRRAARAARAAEARAEAAAGPISQEPTLPRPAGPSPAEATGPGSLLEAKRRARQRTSGDGDAPPTP